MKALLAKVVTAVLLAATLAGCHTVKQESAMEWMERQPWVSDGPP